MSSAISSSPSWRQLSPRRPRCPSSCETSRSSSREFPSPTCSFLGKMMGDGVKSVLTRPLQLVDQVTKLADDARNFKQECQEIKSKADRLSSLLCEAARSDLYERPARRIMDDTEQVLDKALALVSKCHVRRLFIIIPTAAFKNMSLRLDNSLGNVSWLLRVSSSYDDDDDDDDDDKQLGLPPIAQNEPILFLIWEQIATLHTGNPDSRADAAALLVSLARCNDRYGRLIIEEDGVGPLLRLIKDGGLEGQENAARAIGLLSRHPESVEQMVLCGVCPVEQMLLIGHRHDIDIDDKNNIDFG